MKSLNGSLSLHSIAVGTSDIQDGRPSYQSLEGSLKQLREKNQELLRQNRDAKRESTRLKNEIEALCTAVEKGDGRLADEMAKVKQLSEELRRCQARLEQQKRSPPKKRNSRRRPSPFRQNTCPPKGEDTSLQDVLRINADQAVALQELTSVVQKLELKNGLLASDLSKYRRIVDSLDDQFLEEIEGRAVCARDTRKALSLCHGSAGFETHTMLCR